MAGEVGVEGSLHSCPCYHPFSREPSRNLRAWAYTLCLAKAVVLLIRGHKKAKERTVLGLAFLSRVFKP